MDQIRRAYVRQGYPDEFHLDQARFIAPTINGSAVPYAAGVMDILNHEPVTANVMLGVVPFVLSTPIETVFVVGPEAATPSPIVWSK